MTANDGPDPRVQNYGYRDEPGPVFVPVPECSTSMSRSLPTFVSLFRSRSWPTCVSRCLSVMRVPVLSDQRIPVPVCPVCPVTIPPAYPGACLSCVSRYYPTCVSRCLSVMRVPLLSDQRVPVPVCPACPGTIRPAYPGACL